MKETLILKVLVGSRAHGLQNEDSDYDYRGVYITPTSELLSLNHKYKDTNWLEGEKEDNTSWEIAHFLELATKCNPSILEVFNAPIIQIETSRESISSRTDDLHNNLLRQNAFGPELISLFPYIWNPVDAFNSFVGYSDNQEKKMRTNKDEKWTKFAIAGLRTLSNLCDLLSTETFSLEIKNEKFKEILLKIKAEKLTQGDIINLSDKFKNKAKQLLLTCKHVPDLKKVNDFLIRVRKEFWE